MVKVNRPSQKISKLKSLPPSVLEIQTNKSEINSKENAKPGTNFNSKNLQINVTTNIINAI